MNPATNAVLRFFGFAHLPAGPGRDVSEKFCGLAHLLAHTLPDDPESTMALRKLLEAKDAAVRAALEIPYDGSRPRPDPSPHSRACGTRPHEHGMLCSMDCPTCGPRAHDS